MNGRAIAGKRSAIYSKCPTIFVHNPFSLLVDAEIGFLASYIRFARSKYISTLFLSKHIRVDPLSMYYGHKSVVGISKLTSGLVEKQT